MLGRAVVLTLVVALVAAVVGTAVAGLDGLRAAVLAAVLVLAFLLVGQLPVAQAAQGRRGVGAGLLVALYTTRLVLLFLAFRLFDDAGQVDRTVLGVTVIAAAMAWTAGTVWTALRWRPMVVEPEPTTPPVEQS
jgi:hypothetical protein